MNRKVLILTVGGACQPIVKSIKQNKPDYVYFLCSDDNENSKGSYTTVNGTGKVCGGNPAFSKPHTDMNIVTQTTLGGNYEIIKITNPDNFNDCYQRSSEILKECKTKFPEFDILMDYTGGTKSMSSGLVLAASIYPEVIISLVAGQRSDLIKTIDGTEQIRLFKVNNAYLNSYLSKAELLLKNRDYPSVISLLEDLLASYSDIPENLRQQVNSYIMEAKAFDYWDKFEHDKAYLCFSSKEIKKKYADMLDCLRKIMISRSNMDKSFDLEKAGLKSGLEVTGFEIVYDLILNAERKEFKENFDDAVARIYRALELFIQIHLKEQFGLETADINLGKLPNGVLKEKWEKFYNNDKIKIGLLDAYQLLGYINPEDLVFMHFEKIRSRILSVLEARNNSILAHGFQSITFSKYRDIKEIALVQFLLPLIQPKLAEVKFSMNQFPNSFN